MGKAITTLLLMVILGCGRPLNQPGASPNVATIRESPSSIQGGELNGYKFTVAEMTSAQEGTFFHANGTCTVILELQNGRYRFWERSDSIAVPDSRPSHPWVGTYKTDGSNVSLEGMDPSFRYWSFRKINQ